MVPEVYVMNRLPYAGYAQMKLRDENKDKNQEEREKYFSNSGKILKYDEYRDYCKRNKFTPDSPPDGYWESKEEPWHKPTGIALGLFGILLWFIGGLAAGSTGQRGREN